MTAVPSLDKGRRVGRVTLTGVPVSDVAVLTNAAVAPCR